MRKIAVNSLVWVTVVSSRNRPQQNLYWRILRLVCDNHDQFTDVEDLHGWIRIKAGFVHNYEIRGTLVRVPRSTSGKSCSQEEFDRYFNLAMDLVFSELLPGVTLREAKDEIARHL